MISTPVESTPSTISRYRNYDRSVSSRPTIEQIAMGLHTSRTPHFRPLTSGPHSHKAGSGSPHHSYPYDKLSHRVTSHIPPVLPPPPTRSSLKQGGKSHTTLASTTSGTLRNTSPASSSSTTVTSHLPPSSHPPSPSFLKLHMSRFFPKLRNSSAPSPPRGDLPLKKAVRFSSETEP